PMRLGGIGLAHRRTPELTDPRNVTGLTFLDYGPILERELPLLRAAGAEHITVLVHDEPSALLPLKDLLRREGVRVVGVGHAHQSVLVVDDGETPEDPLDDIVFCSGGAYLRGYCSVHLKLDGGAITGVWAEVHRVESATEAEATQTEQGLVGKLAELVSAAGLQADALGGQTLAVTTTKITRRDHAVGQYVVDSWLEALPRAQVALTNQGAIRQDLEAGPIRVRDVHSTLPFDNTLLLLEVRGRDLRALLEHPESLAGGVNYRYRTVSGRREVVALQLRDGSPIDERAVYRVVVTDFMYRGGDGYELSHLDGTPEETGIDWRAPVIHRLQREHASGTPLSVTADDRAAPMTTADAAQR
ncbi:MAG: 5'-nucleotidase C-terminal domain-containing protein, partial [Myxococcota bacterium]